MSVDDDDDDGMWHTRRETYSSGTAAELAVGGGNTSVNDIDVGARASSGVVDVASSSSGPVRDTGQAILGWGLGGQSTLVEADWDRGVDLGVGLDALHVRHVGNGVDLAVITVESKALGTVSLSCYVCISQ